MLNKYFFSYKSCLLIFDDNCFTLKFCHPAYSQISLKVPICRRKTWQKRGWHHICRKEQVPFKGAIAFTIVRQIFAGEIQALIIVLALLQSIWISVLSTASKILTGFWTSLWRALRNIKHWIWATTNLLFISVGRKDNQLMQLITWPPYM